MYFTQSQLPLLDLLYQNSYVIPAYQRPYSWCSHGKSNKNDQVNQLWSDLLEAFTENPKEIYFFGSMVTIQRGERRFEVVDGQQRLTTISLLFAAMKCFFIWAASQNLIRDEQENFLADKEVENLINAITANYDEMIFNKGLPSQASKPSEKKLRIEKFDGFDYDNILKLSMTCTLQQKWASRLPR